MKIMAWNEAKYKKELSKRLKRAKNKRKQFEPLWDIANRAVGNLTGQPLDEFFSTGSEYDVDNTVDEDGSPESSFFDVGTNFIFKNVSFWHSQMSANAPSSVAVPNSSDQEDRLAAEAADKIGQHLRRVKDISEEVDQMNIDVLVTGTGYIKHVWDSMGGDITKFDEETQEPTLEGDVSVYSPSCSDMWMDADARSWREVRHVFERIKMPVEEAMFRWPKHAETIKKYVNLADGDELSTEKAEGQDQDAEIVEIYEYYEKGRPENGFAGRFARCLNDGTPLEWDSNPNPNKNIPYQRLTYMDVKGTPYGISRIAYCIQIQDEINQFDAQVLENIQAHNNGKFLEHEDGELDDNDITDSARQRIRWSGSREPRYLSPPTLMQDGWKWRQGKVLEIDELFGINDSMRGIQRREQSAVSQQTSINQGVMVHNRLFKKYQSVVSALYNNLLAIVAKEWDTPRQVRVLGKEHAFESIPFSGADVQSGYEFYNEYGTSLPTDPVARREMLMLMMPALKEGGVEMRQILRMFKLSEVEPALDVVQMAERRQEEIFKEMLAKLEAGYLADEAYIKPRMEQPHEHMLALAESYVVRAEFFNLSEEEKQIIEGHIQERRQMWAAKQAEMAKLAAGAMPQMDPGVQTLPGMPGVGGALSPELQIVSDDESI